MFGDPSSVSKALLAELLDDEPGEDEADWEVSDLYDEESTTAAEAVIRSAVRKRSKEGVDTTDRLIDDVWQEVGFRRDIAGANYPVVDQGESLISSMSWPQMGVTYAFLLLLGVQEEFEVRFSATVPARLFEGIVARALAMLIGGAAIRFGWPRRNDGRRANLTPTAFRARAQQLSKSIQESPGSMRAVSQDAKDHGLDVIAWRSFDDNRPGQPIVLCQCAIGSEWKTKSVDIDKWRDVINFAVVPARAIAFPLIPPSGADAVWQWYNVAAGGGVPLDRLRIASLVSDSHFDAKFIDEIRRWTVTALPNLRRD
jgi:hypothetical protein